jgi:catechol 2,3-dioxygenase-like lactoylglutathione lyase family enzyme
VKTHLNLATSDLVGSVAFYSTLLNAKPIKLLTDYALFVTEQPGLELALDRRSAVSPSTDAHYGIYVETASDVERAIERLTEAGLATSIEREETCCYASQTKVWAIDPDGRRWEVYTVHEETEERDNAATTCCSNDAGTRECCSA